MASVTAPAPAPAPETKERRYLDHGQPLWRRVLLTREMAIIGLLIVVKGMTAAATDDDAIGVVPWRGLILILAALVFFGTTVRGLGLVAAIFGAACLAALASRSNGPVAALVIAVCLTAACVLIFHYGLAVTVPLVGPWLR